MQQKQRYSKCDQYRKKIVSVWDSKQDVVKQVKGFFFTYSGTIFSLHKQKHT